jgi:hypothetical protein
MLKIVTILSAHPIAKTRFSPGPGRSEGGLEAYAFQYVERLSDAITQPQSIFSIL